MLDNTDGGYVRHEDYAALEQQLAESNRALRAETTAHENTQMQLEKMAAENAGLKAVSDDRRTFIMNGVQLGYIKVPTVETDPALETIRIAVSPQEPTPATDSFLAEERAQIAEEALKIMGNFTSDECGDSVYIAVKEFAESLRKGAQS